MAENIALETAVQSIKNAFRPLRCSVELQDHDNRLSFRVFDPNNEVVLDGPDVLAAKVCDPSSLQLLIEQSRAAVTRRGYTLEPWSQPI